MTHRQLAALLGQVGAHRRAAHLIPLLAEIHHRPGDALLTPNSTPMLALSSGHEAEPSGSNKRTGAAITDLP